MAEKVLVGAAIVLALGMFAQWLAWKYRFPSILILLVFGFIAGPITGVLDPQYLFGDLIFPIVSISVAIILFEGGLSLQLSGIKEYRGVVFRLITLGVIVTWLVAGWAANTFLKLDVALSVLFGAIVTVSGPTVVLPLLRHIRPRAPLSDILKWEGILIDPVGALFAVIVFEAIVAGEFYATPVYILQGVAETLFFGGLIGAGAAYALAFAIKRHLFPDFLETPIVFGVVVVSYVLSNHFHAESGLLAVTLMGVLLANIKDVTIHHVLEFKENLRVLIISVLFIILAARVSQEQVLQLDIVGEGIFLAILILFARPLSVFVSTIGSGLTFREIVFLSWVAPRGIVAAAVASLFSIELIRRGHSQAELLVPYTFLVIVATVTVYGLTASPLARRLKLSQRDPQGVLFLGANDFIRDIAKLLQADGLSVLVADTNYENITSARNEGLPTFFGNILSEENFEQLDLDGIGNLLAMTPNHDANSLAALRLSEYFDRSHIYQLPPKPEQLSANSRSYPSHLQGRLLFKEDAYSDRLDRAYRKGAIVKSTKMTDEYGFAEFTEFYGDDAMPLCFVTEGGHLQIFNPTQSSEPKAGSNLIALLFEKE